MKKRILALAGVLALVAVLVMPTAVFATNTSVQNASTSQATTIIIVSKVGDDPIASITFPAGAPAAVISNPYNDVDIALPQVLDDTASEPVVRLKNGSGGTLTIWLGVTALSGWTDAVASERFKLVDVGTTSVASLTSEATLGASASTVTTIAAAAYKALYLEVTLGALTGKTGTSTLTVLGES